MTSGEGGRCVLVVEDHGPTAKLVSTLLEDTQDSLSTLVVGDGETCLDVLEGDDAARPDLVLLDLDLPVLDGYAVLERRQEEQSLRRVPTIILSNTDDNETIEQCYEHGANAFIFKPGELDEYEAIAEQVTQFWFRTAVLPRA